MSLEREAEMLRLLADSVGEVCVHEVPAIQLTTELAELGLDSVQTLELLACLEERLGTRLPPERLAGVVTVADLLAVVERQPTLAVAR